MSVKLSVSYHRHLSNFMKVKKTPKSGFCEIVKLLRDLVKCKKWKWISIEKFKWAFYYKQNAETKCGCGLFSTQNMLQFWMIESLVDIFHVLLNHRIILHPGIIVDTRFSRLLHQLKIYGRKLFEVVISIGVYVPVCMEYRSVNAIRLCEAQKNNV